MADFRKVFEHIDKVGCNVGVTWVCVCGGSSVAIFMLLSGRRAGKAGIMRMRLSSLSGLTGSTVRRVGFPWWRIIRQHALPWRLSAGTWQCTVGPLS